MNKILNRIGGAPARRRHAKIDTIKKDPQLKVILDKLVPAHDGGVMAQHSNRPLRTIDLGDAGRMNAVTDHSAQNISDANSLFQLLPDLELAMQIMVSSILSPKDLTTVELNYSFVRGSVDAELGGTLLEVIREHFEQTYKIKKILTPALQAALFTEGSYPLLILPENSVDDMINSPRRVSMESVRVEFTDDMSPKPVGLLGASADRAAKQRVSMEDLGRVDYKAITANEPIRLKGKETYVTVTDNPTVLKKPMLMDKIRQDRIQSVFGRRGIGLEARSERFSDQQLSSLYQRRHYTHVPIMPILTQDQLERGAVGHPLVMKLPAESIIPVHVPSNPSEHIGYFVLLDQTGNPVTKSKEVDYYRQMGDSLKNNKEMSSTLIQMTREGQNGMEIDYSSYVDQATETYTQLIEADLLSRLKNGAYPEGAELGKNQELYRVMLSRSLKRQQTQLLYVPAELMTYIAFDYNQFGVGQSLLDASKIVGGIRSILMFANTMAAIKNSVPHVGMNIQLDPNDPDPAGTVEFLVQEYAKVKKASYPLGSSNPLDIINFLQNAGTNLNVSGHAAYPETRVELDNKSTSHTSVDGELEEQMKRRHLMSLGLAPETVDMGMNVDFATSIVTNNLLLAKRVMLYQDRFVEFLQDFIRKYVLNSGTLMDDLRGALNGNRKKLDKEQRKLPDDVIIMHFVNSIELSLPSPDSATLETQIQAFETYNRALDMALEAYLSREFLDEIALGEFYNDADGAVAAIKAYFQRQWLRENNMLPELASLTTLNEKGDPDFDLLEAHGGHIEAIGKSLEGYILEMKKQNQKREERIRKFEERFDLDEEGGDADRDYGDGDSEGADAGADDFADGDGDGVGEDSLVVGTDDVDMGADDVADEPVDEPAEEEVGEEEPVDIPEDEEEADVPEETEEEVVDLDEEEDDANVPDIDVGVDDDDDAKKESEEESEEDDEGELTDEVPKPKKEDDEDDEKKDKK